MIELTGNTWDHPRGFAPLVATAKAYMATHPDVRITWTARTAEDFPDYPIDRLADVFDLMVIDHPIIGSGVNKRCLVALDEVLDAEFMADQASNSVGKSHVSYVYEGHQWALAIDAASHVSAYRPDLLERLEADVPRTWDAVLALAARLKAHSEERRWIGIPLLPVNTLMCFCSLCANAGEEPFGREEAVVSRDIGHYALKMLKELTNLSHPASREWHPPTFLEHMGRGDELVYCPLTFGYSNYARLSYDGRVVRFANIPLAHDGTPRGAILGGTGLAVSNRSKYVEAACEYAAYVANFEVQCTTYFSAGGQPGYRAAWLDDKVNRASSNFFYDTLDTLDRAYLRPTDDGFIELQDRTSHVIANYLWGDVTAENALTRLDDLYRSSQRTA
jgi:multiple sugar transport system substrate-binding protein